MVKLKSHTKRMPNSPGETFTPEKSPEFPEYIRTLCPVLPIGTIMATFYTVVRV